MILTILILIVFIILTKVSIKNDPIKKVKNIFDVYYNSSIYNLVGIVIAAIIGFIIYLFQKPWWIGIARILGVFPTIGVSLPFFSYGGSGLWGFTILLFIFIKMDANKVNEW